MAACTASAAQAAQLMRLLLARGMLTVSRWLHLGEGAADKEKGITVKQSRTSAGDVCICEAKLRVAKVDSNS